MNDYGWEYKGDKFRNITEAFGKNLCDGYESPIELYTTDFCNKIIEERESAIVAEISEQIGLNIDKEELLKALAYDRNQYQKGYADALLRCGTPQFEWIPVSERLPEQANQSYLVTVDYGNGLVCSCQRFFFNEDIGWNDDCVIAWQPLPEPYKEGDEE